ncbi:MAG TPA: VOC family protein, partial [Acidobacteriota bacterium]|nr:VOC family protein [Acidobacteriota bacterium]
DHIALNVLDIGKAFDELKAAGLTIIEKEPVYLPFWEKGIKYFNVLGPDGERVEFAERLR